MRRINLLAILFLSIFALTGCAVRADYRVRDPYYNDYHVWNNDEVVYYNRWRVETRRPDVDYRHLRRDDQREYWRWRHDHH
jgi:hypothetical protein